MRIILGIILGLATILGCGYMLIWWGIIDPIMTIAEAIDQDAVTASLVAWEVCKFLLREIATVVVAFIGITLTGMCFKA